MVAVLDDAAVDLFEQAYAIDPQPNYLFNIGRVYEEKGDLKKAVEYYQRFVQEPGVQIESRDRAAQRLRVLKAIVEDDKNPDQQPEGPKPEEPKAEPLPTTTPQDAPDPNRNMRLSGYGLGAEVIEKVIAQLEAHGMVKLGEQRAITPEVSRAILEAAL